MNIAIQRGNKGRDGPLCAEGNGVGEHSRKTGMMPGGSGGSVSKAVLCVNSKAARRGATACIPHLG